MAGKIKITEEAGRTTIVVNRNAPFALKEFLKNKDEIYNKLAEGASLNELNDLKPFFPFYVPPHSGE